MMTDKNIKNALHNILVQYAKKMTDPQIMTSDKDETQLYIAKVVYLSNDPTYQKNVHAAMKHLHLRPAEQVKKDLRHDIISEIGTPRETDAVTDASELELLDDDPTLKYPNLMDFEVRPDFSTLERLIQNVSTKY